VPYAEEVVYNLVHISFQVIIIQLPLSVFTAILIYPLHLPHLRINTLVSTHSI